MKQSVRLLSADKIECTCQRDVLTQFELLSSVLEDMDEDVDEDECIPVPNVTDEILQKVLAFASYHLENAPVPIPEPLVLPLEDIVSDFDRSFLRNKGFTELVALANAAKYLEYQALLDMCAAKCASMVLGKSKEEVFRMAGIPP